MGRKVSKIEAEIGPVELPADPVVVEAFAEAARMNDAILEAEEEVKTRKEALSAAKSHLKTLQGDLTKHLRVHSHKTDLPLLSDPEAREADQQAMEAAAAAGGTL